MTREKVLSDYTELADRDIDPARLALRLGALDKPGIELHRYEKHLDDLAGAVASRSQLKPEAALAEVISQLFGYRGDRQTYDDMKNANLIDVIDRRRGLPVALGLLYLSAARAQGWTLVGLNFPSHFLLRLETGPERVIIDPFNDGRILSPGDLRGLIKRLAGAEAELMPAFFAPVGPRDVVIRLLSNIKIRAERANQFEEASQIAERMTLVQPSDGRLWAELGRLHVRTGNLSAALTALERSLKSAPSDSFRTAVEDELRSLQRRLN